MLCHVVPKKLHATGRAESQVPEWHCRPSLELPARGEGKDGEAAGGSYRTVAMLTMAAMQLWVGVGEAVRQPRSGYPVKNYDGWQDTRRNQFREVSVNSSRPLTSLRN